jgi:hypothetical protein
MRISHHSLIAVICILAGGGIALGQERITNDGGITFEVQGTSLPGRAATTTLSGQTQTLCEGNNHNSSTFLNNVSMGGPLVGISWLPNISAPILITRIEVFTGETAGPIALAIWSNASGQPGVNLGNTISIPTVLPNSWQGADLTSPIVIAPSTQYWVTLDPTGGEQAPVEQVIVGQTYWGSYTGGVTGGATWFGPFSFPDRGWKFRMFCRSQDDFKCYSVQGANLGATVNLVDQFESVQGVNVTKPRLLCNPVDKNGEGIPNPLAHLVCYEIKQPHFRQRDVLVSNQFGQAQLKVKAPELLCVPSTKNENLPCGPTGIRMCGGTCPDAGDVCVVRPDDAGCECRPATPGCVETDCTCNSGNSINCAYHATCSDPQADPSVLCPQSCAGAGGWTGQGTCGAPSSALCTGDPNCVP